VNKPASACRLGRVKQIWCNSRADGYSPDGREYLVQEQLLLPVDMAEFFWWLQTRLLLSCAALHALILVKEKEKLP